MVLRKQRLPTYKVKLAAQLAEESMVLAAVSPTIQPALTVLLSLTWRTPITSRWRRVGASQRVRQSGLCSIV